MLKVKITSVVDRYRFHADPDPTLHVDAYPDPDPDWPEKEADLFSIHMRILSQVLHILKNKEFFSL